MSPCFHANWRCFIKCPNLSVIHGLPVTCHTALRNSLRRPRFPITQGRGGPFIRRSPILETHFGRFWRLLLVSVHVERRAWKASSATAERPPLNCCRRPTDFWRWRNFLEACSSRGRCSVVMRNTRLAISSCLLSVDSVLVSTPTPRWTNWEPTWNNSATPPSFTGFFFQIDRLVDWGLTALSAQIGFVVPLINKYAVALTPWGTGARAPYFYQWLGTEALWVEEQQTRNWPICTDHHDRAYQND